MFSRMGNCLKTNNQTKTNEIIISIVGLDDSGKSTIAKALKGEKDLTDVAPTVGYEPYEFLYNARDLKVYDLGGGSRVRDIWKHYLAESFGFIYVIDASNRNRINECKTVFSTFLENEKVAGKPILILANKQDQANTFDESEIVQYLNVEELVNKFQIPCRIETCVAISGTGNKLDKSLKTGFDWLLKHIILSYDAVKTRIDYDVSLQKTEESRIRREKSDKIRSKRDNDYSSYYNDDDLDKGDPWKPLSELKNKDSKIKQDNSKLSAYDKQLLDEMRVSSPRPGRLTTIDEEKSKLKNKFLKSNKLGPYDDKSDYESSNKSKNQTAWAITDNNISSIKRTSFDKPVKGRFEV